ncbi:MULTISPECIES: sulfatase-like hydrolase/transferase [unclassified Lentimonas]|uniref:sulfatase-like hydrolase/transferase n=1 Tax=unclassified Lentimonas TaxID=2630993 RepID=UPI001325924A|nr:MULTISPECIES: sulfatase-like hydrolase/transferase [unclassified Lentimonas]CAA6695221.1 Choline-sulfatase (EC [Lentimonas sp. CC19]CAA6697325.1 Choline-sulfatase (EC [Lentimonas sp. CC10]CAA7070409.1 Choline-sulfatase (EC [Lentimonas sp. CC11]
MSHTVRPKAIILIQSDQHRADCLGCNGHPLVQTPNMDRMAANGLNHKQAHTPAPVCTPARTCLETGMWAAEHGTIHNWDGPSPKYIQPGINTWAKAFSEHGWSCDYIGRWHVTPEHTPTDFGYCSYLSDHDYNQWRAAEGLQSLDPVTSEIGIDAFLGCTDPHITADQSELGWLMDRALDRITERAATDAPFLIRLDSFAPHLPNRVPEPYASMYAPDSIEPWGSFDDQFVNKPYIQKQQLETWNIADFSWLDWAPVVSRYLGDITLLDHQIGRLMERLEQLGILDDTLIIYTSDHGDMCGGHRMLDKHFIMYDDVTRVPLILHWPNGIKQHANIEHFVSQAIDIPVTLCEVAGVPVPETFSGQSLLDPSVKPRETIYSAYDGNQFGLYTQRMVRTHEWKYVWNATDIDELYDLTNDPHELENRIKDTGCTEIIRELRKELVAWHAKTHDPMDNPWVRDALLSGRVQ